MTAKMDYTNEENLRLGRLDYRDGIYTWKKIHIRGIKVHNGGLTYYYVTNIAKAKRFNLQSIAINNFINGINKQRFIMDLDKDIEEFNNLYSPYLSRDIVFKNNSLVTRKSTLISPAHYFYFTKLVIDLVLDSCEDNELQYKSKNIKAYYSGVLYNSINMIENPKQISFDNSYNQFQEELLKNEGKQAIKIDLSNFFDSINIGDLINILYVRYDTKKVRNLEIFFRYLGIFTLPQFHYSIGSSILSQEYLVNFDNDIKRVLTMKNFNMVRFVDDMFLFKNGNRLEEREFHTTLDKINNILWKNKLNLNTKKVVLYINNLFSRKLSEDIYVTDDDYKFKTEERIEVKSNSLVNNEFMEFIKKVNFLYLDKGYNIEKFSRLFESAFSVDQDKDNDSRKVLNNFVFGHKWKGLKKSDLIYIISNYQFVFFLPNIFLTLYLMIYEFIEKKNGKDEDTIRKLLNEIDSNNADSLRYLYSSLSYLIQRNFKRTSFIKKITKTEESLGEFIKKYIAD